MTPRPLLALVPLLAVLIVSAREPSKPIPAASVSPADRPRGTYTLTSDAESRWVAFDLTPGNQIRFTMQLDGRDVTAILDTGVSFSLLAKASAAVDRSKVVAGGSATAIGGTVPLEWMPTRTLAIGGLKRTGGGVTIAELPAIATGSTTAVDLLVGADLLAGHALDIDYAARRFRLLRSGRMPFTGDIAPLSVSRARNVYESAIRLGNRSLAPMIVDTGDGSAITVTKDAWKSAKLGGLPVTSAIAFGLAGPTISELAIAPELKVGDLVARSTEVRIEPADGFSQSIGAAGRIGSGFFQNYRVLLDPAASRMVFSPGPTANATPLRSTSGLLMGVESDRLKVLHVMRGGPAEASGWHVGDLICTIDGTPIPSDYPTSTLATWSVRPPGSKVKLGLCDGPTRTLVLKHFY